MSVRSGSYQTMPVSIPVGGELEINQTGRFFRVLNADQASIGIKIGGDSEMFTAEGITCRMQPGEQFTKVVLINKSDAIALNATVAFGMGDIDDSRFSIVDGALAVQPDGANTPFNVTPREPAASDGATLTMAGGANSSAPLGLQANANRARAHIQNAGAGQIKLVGGSGFVFIEPGEKFTVRGGGAFTVSNPNAFAVNVATLLEMWT